MNAQKCIKELKQKLMEKLDIMECFAEDRLFFMQHSKDKMLVGVEQFDYANQDKYFFLYDSADILNSEDDFYGPVAMIKFMPNQNNKDEMFIRRLEFINDDCRGKGYASCLIKLFETYCEKNGYKNISGEMIPLHDVPEDVVENYYKRNGFAITEQNGQKMIDKKVEKPVQAMVEGVTLVKNKHYEFLKSVEKFNQNSNGVKIVEEGYKLKEDEEFVELEDVFDKEKSKKANCGVKIVDKDYKLKKGEEFVELEDVLDDEEGLVM